MRGRVAAWLRAATRRLPELPRALGVAEHLARPLHARLVPGPVRAEVHGRRLDLDARDHVEGLMLLAPHLYDARERRFLRSHLHPGDVFVDGGAFLGAYSLDLRDVATVVAVEPDARTADRLSRALEGDGVVVRAALTGEDGVVHLGPPPHGNAGARALADHGVPVEGVTLPTLAERLGLPRVHAVKLDLEGGEGPVVAAALSAWDRARWPRAWVIEAPRGTPSPAVERLRRAGYTTRRVSRLNVGATLPT